MCASSRRDARRAAFTLVEMMVVIVILGLLATLVVPNVMNNLTRAEVGKIKSDLVALASALEDFAMQNAGRYPDDLTVLVRPDENGHAFLKTDTLPKDPWGVEYQYEAPFPGHPTPRLFTLGKDMQLGGEGADRDIDDRMIRNGEIK